MSDVCWWGRDTFVLASLPLFLHTASKRLRSGLQKLPTALALATVCTCTAWCAGGWDCPVHLQCSVLLPFAVCSAAQPRAARGQGWSVGAAGVTRHCFRSLHSWLQAVRHTDRYYTHVTCQRVVTLTVPTLLSPYTPLPVTCQRVVIPRV